MKSSFSPKYVSRPLSHYVGLFSKQLRSRAKILSAIILASLTVFTYSAHANDTVKIVAFGDSLTAGYQLPPEAAFPVQLEKALKAKGYNVTVANAGVSGDTTTGGLERLDWAVPNDTKIVILELGANDALRGITPEKTRANLEAIITKLKSKGAKILLAGMKAPRNLGKEYTDKFDQIYEDLANKHKIALYPFFLDGVALNPDLNLSDGIHPNTKGVSIIVNKILPHIEKLIKEQTSK